MHIHSLVMTLLVAILTTAGAYAQSCEGFNGKGITMCADVQDKNVLGTALELCCTDPVTGFTVMVFAKRVIPMLARMSPARA